MISLLQCAQRNWRTLYPAEAPKQPDALRIGLLGASNIAPIAVINAAKTHPEVIVAAVAARDEKRARDYAQKHRIPNVHTSYQALLDDPTIDVIYNPLPNGLHYEWTLKALKAGKHVLLEKPSTSNAAEARSLFRNPLLAENGGSLVLLDAVHIRFHPAWQKCLSLLDPADLSEVKSMAFLPKGMFPNDDIRFRYDLAAGCLMDVGSYTVQTLRQAFGAEPVECVSANARRMPAEWDQNIDQAFSASWKFPNGGTGSIVADSSTTNTYLSWLTDRLPSIQSPVFTAKHREKIVPHPTLAGMVTATTKTVVFWNFMGPSLWHRIDVVEDHVLQDTKTGRIEKTWTDRKYLKHYEGDVGNASWTTYRHMLEQFINKIRGREGSGIWIDGKDSICQMEMVDGAYVKSGLPVRPSATLEQ